ncbi:hypothetical protein L2V44_14195, partial [Staphylococcus aureus]|nr:hypothetical protein [Staphylococcus aureus]
WDCFTRMGLTEQDLQPYPGVIYGFNGSIKRPAGTISLLLKVGKKPLQGSALINFCVLKVDSLHNAIMGRPSLNRLRAIVDTYSLTMKYPTLHGVGTVRGVNILTSACYQVAIKEAKHRKKQPANSSEQPTSDLRSPQLTISPQVI